MAFALLAGLLVVGSSAAAVSDEAQVLVRVWLAPVSFSLVFLLLLIAACASPFTSIKLIIIRVRWKSSIAPRVGFGPPE